MARIQITARPELVEGLVFSAAATEGQGFDWLSLSGFIVGCIAILKTG
jgi:hypothetical protein